MAGCPSKCNVAECSVKGFQQKTIFEETVWPCLYLASHWLQVLSGGQDGAVCVWEVQQQRLLARQSIAAAHVPICESVHPLRQHAILSPNHQC